MHPAPDADDLKDLENQQPDAEPPPHGYCDICLRPLTRIEGRDAGHIHDDADAADLLSPDALADAAKNTQDMHAADELENVTDILDKLILVSKLVLESAHSHDNLEDFDMAVSRRQLIQLENFLNEIGA